MRFAVTGAAGFVGAHLVAALREAGHDVLPVVREPRPTDPEGARALADVLVTPAVFAGLDSVIHAAAVRHRYGVGEAAYREANVGLTESVLRAAAGRARRFVHVSSVGVYGWPKRLPIDESFPFAPRGAYSASKVEAERVVARVAREIGIEQVIVRPTIVYGRGDTNGMLDKLARMIRSGTYLLVGDGQNTLHHTYVDDVVRGISAAATAPDAAGRDFILAGPETTTLGELSELVAREVGRPLRNVRVPLRLARAVATVVDTAAARGLFRREPPVSNEKLDVMTLSIAFDASKASRLLGVRAKVRYMEGVARTLRSGS
jgi:nucleoside-diphosphate-sugar epimerase